MDLAEYLKGTKSPMVLISHDILQDQINLVEKYRDLVTLKDSQIKNLQTQVDLLKAQKGGLDMVITNQDKELKKYRDLPRIDTRS